MGPSRPSVISFVYKMSVNTKTSYHSIISFSLNSILHHKHLIAALLLLHVHLILELIACASLVFPHRLHIAMRLCRTEC